MKLFCHDLKSRGDILEQQTEERLPARHGNSSLKRPGRGQGVGDASGMLPAEVGQRPPAIPDAPDPPPPRADSGFFQQLSFADVPGGVQGFIHREQEHYLRPRCGESAILPSPARPASGSRGGGRAGRSGGLQGESIGTPPRVQKKTVLMGTI